MPYKVVFRYPHDDTLTSIIAPYHSQVIYMPGEKTYPKVLKSKLFIFEDFLNAKQWREEEEYWEIWECEAGDVLHRPEFGIAGFGPGTPGKIITQFWEENRVNPAKAQFTIQISRADIPYGCLTCDWVKLIKQVT